MNGENDLKVIVAGRPNSGKSHLLFLIEQTLKENGIKCPIRENDMELYERRPDMAVGFEDRLAKIKNTLTVEFSTQQINREGILRDNTIKNKKKGEE